MEFVKRSAPPDRSSAGATSRDGVAGILAKYGVQPASPGERPEIEDDDEPTGPRGSSGEGGTRNKQRQRAAWDRAMLESACNFDMGGPNREALVQKYPALQDGTGK